MKIYPIYIYNNNLSFGKNQRFILTFSDGEVLKGMDFSKENDYYSMSMSCFIEVSNDITKLKQYDDVEKKNQSLQIVISETELIMVLSFQKSKLFSTIKPTNLRLIK